MLNSFIFIVFNISIAFSQSMDFSKIEGDYSLVIEQKDAKYLQCSFDQSLSIKSENASILVYGASKKPIVFKNINGKPNGFSGPLMGYFQNRSIVTEQSETTLVLENQIRECSGLFSDIGCIGKKWRSTAWLIFNKFSDTEAYVVLSSQAFKNSELEACTYLKD